MPCRQLGQLVRIFTLSCAPTAPLLRKAASPFLISSVFLKRTWVEMSGRETPSVPDSPQQRSLFKTLSPTSARTVAMESPCFIGLWQGSWYR